MQHGVLVPGTILYSMVNGMITASVCCGTGHSAANSPARKYSRSQVCVLLWTGVSVLACARRSRTSI